MHPVKWLHDHAHVVSHSQHYGHLLYFGAVCFDGHGTYVYAAALLLALGVVALVSGEGGDV